MITDSSDTDIADRSLEFNQGVSLVVWVRWASLAAGTEIGVMADSTLVSITLDIRLSTIGTVAKRSITVDAMVTSLGSIRSRHGCDIVEGFVDGYEAMASMDEASIDVAGWAEVPVWAIKALVTNTVDVLVASIANGIMSNVTARSEKCLSNDIEMSILNSWLECMLGVVAMLHTNVARNAEVVVRAWSASNEVLLSEFLNARVTSTSSNWDLQGLGEVDLGTLRLRRHGLSGAVDDLSILYDTLDEPMIFALAENSVVNASLAEIKITILASAAVVMNIRDGLIAVVAINSEDADSLGGSGALAALGRKRREFSKPLITGSGATSDWDFCAWTSVHSRSLSVMINACSILVEAAWDTAAGRVDDRRGPNMSKGIRHSATDGRTRNVGSGGDQEILESTLKFGNRAWESYLLSVLNSGGFCRSWGCRFDKGFGNRLPLDNGADWSNLLLLVLDRSWLWCNGCLILNGHLETKLELSLGSSIELLVDWSVVRVENDECSGTVGISLKYSLSRGWDRE
jgi:hypothetical protein